MAIHHSASMLEWQTLQYEKSAQILAFIKLAFQLGVTDNEQIRKVIEWPLLIRALEGETL